MTFKKAEIEKNLRNGLSMSETAALNHKRVDFAIQLGLALHQFHKNLLLKPTEFIQNRTEIDTIFQCVHCTNSLGRVSILFLQIYLCVCSSTTMQNKMRR